MSKITGKVKFFNQEKAFGFITPNGGGKDIFVHKNDCNDDLRQDDEVEFETKNGRKGVQASNVSVLN